MLLSIFVVSCVFFTVEISFPKHWSGGNLVLFWCFNINTCQSFLRTGDSFITANWTSQGLELESVHIQYGQLHSWLGLLRLSTVSVKGILVCACRLPKLLWTVTLKGLLELEQWLFVPVEHLLNIWDFLLIVWAGTCFFLSSVCVLNWLSSQS